MIDKHGNLFIETGGEIDCFKVYRLPWMVPKGTFDGLYEWLLEQIKKPAAGTVSKIPSRCPEVALPFEVVYTTPNLAVIFGLRDLPYTKAKRTLETVLPFVMYPCEPPAGMEWTVVNPTVGTNGVKPKAKSQGIVRPVMSVVRYPGKRDVWAEIATHCSASLKSQDAIADGEGRMVRLDPDYFSDQAIKPEEKDDSEREIKKGTWEHRTWRPVRTYNRKPKGTTPGKHVYIHGRRLRNPLWTRKIKATLAERQAARLCKVPGHPAGCRCGYTDDGRGGLIRVSLKEWHFQLYLKAWKGAEIFASVACYNPAHRGRPMTYELTFNQTLNGKPLTMERTILEENMSNFETEMDSDPNVKSWRRFGGNGWCEVTSNTKSISPVIRS